jgi:hypothetical protein
VITLAGTRRHPLRLRNRRRGKETGGTQAFRRILIVCLVPYSNSQIEVGYYGRYYFAALGSIDDPQIHCD